MPPPRQMRTLTPDSFLGCLFGCAVGDALGAPFRDGDLLAALPEDSSALAYTRMLGYPLGQYTDDTQMTMAVAQSITEAGGIDGASMARTLQRLWLQEEILDPRPTCTEAIGRLGEDGEGWEHSGVETAPLDLGSVVRSVPIGLWLSGDPRALVAAVSASSYITHADELSCGAAVAVARTVAYVSSHEEFVTERCLYRVGTAAALVAPEYADWIPRIGEALLEDPDDAEAHLSIDDADPGINTTLWALYAALRHPTDFLAAVHTAITSGREPDISAAIAGAIVGAHGGLDAIPSALVDTLWQSERIREIANALATRYAAAVEEASES